MRTMLKMSLEIGLGDGLDGLGYTNSESLVMPKYARVRHVALDPNNPVKIGLWFEVDYENDPIKIQAIPHEERRFVVVGTGRPVQDRAEYIGTVSHRPRADGRTFIWHVYELR